MEPRILTKPAFSVMGLTVSAKGGSPEIPGLWEKLMPRLEEISGRNSDDAFGVIDNFDEEAGEMDYTAGYQVEASQQPPSGMTVVHVPAQTYAVFECTLPTLMEALDRAYHAWLPNSGYRRARGPEFEYYGEDFFASDPDSPMSIFVPIESG
ncbi:MAG: GyrI-like domain-containing protein [Anaerolineales bacterium]|jgi:AraC family transcriptional regulator